MVVRLLEKECLKTVSNNKNFWEELITYFSFNVISASDTISRKNILVFMRNEVSKTIQFGRLQYSCY
jgi:hypothetical protein